jgi:hypothetical protein
MDQNAYRDENDPGHSDPGHSDPGHSDAGQFDPGESDAGQFDPGESDAGEFDGGQSDAGQFDPGESDAGESDPGQPDSYWRRRVITLAAGLTVLGLLAWAFSGGGGKPVSPAPKTSQAAGVLPAAAYSGGPAPSSGADGSGAPGSVMSRPSDSGLPSPSPTLSAGSRRASGQPSTRATASGRAKAGSPAAAGTSASGTQRGGACSPRAVVLSLFTSRYDYYGGQHPEFEVDAVSTAPGSCTFETSPEKLYVVVLSSGRIIWDSADCARGQASRVAALSRGVPAQESVSWNRTVSLPGCVTLASAARPGSYQVQARTGTVASPVRTFKLVR